MISVFLYILLLGVYHIVISLTGMTRKSYCDQLGTCKYHFTIDYSVLQNNGKSIAQLLRKAMCRIHPVFEQEISYIS